MSRGGGGNGSQDLLVLGASLVMAAFMLNWVMASWLPLFVPIFVAALFVIVTSK